MSSVATTNTAFGAELLRHLQSQLDSARRLLDCVLRQGQAIRARDVEAVLGRMAEIQTEMERRARLERERTQLLQTAAHALAVPAHAVTLDQITTLLSVPEAAAAQGRSAELRGLLTEIGREHTVNRALMRQELSFLDHLTRMMGGGDQGGYAPPSEPGAQMRTSLEPTIAARRVLDLEA